MQSATRLVMRGCLFCVSLRRDSYPLTANGYAGYLVNRLNLFRIFLMILLSHDVRISPDKNMSFPCATAAFTLPHEPSGFVMLCQLAQGLSLVCGFCPSARTFANGLPSDPSLRRRPCLRLILLLAFIVMNTYRFSYRGLSPHKLTLMPGCTQVAQSDGYAAACLNRWAGQEIIK